MTCDSHPRPIREIEVGIRKGDLKLIQWTPEHGSVGCVVTKTARLKISGLPCYLCSAPVIEYILGPFGSVKSHETKTEDHERDIAKSISTYKCTLWCVGLSCPENQDAAGATHELNRDYCRKKQQMPYT